MKKYFNKELVRTEKDNFENSTKCSICDHVFVECDVKVRDHCHINKKYIGSAHEDCNINVKSNHKIPIVFHNLKNYESHLMTRQNQFENKCYSKCIRKMREF